MSYEYGTLEYAIDAHLRKHDDATRPKRVAEVCALVNAKLGPAEIAPEPTPEYDGPGEDAGEALVGVRCYAWGPHRDAFAVETVIVVNADGLYQMPRGLGCWTHARPVALGLPEWLKA